MTPRCGALRRRATWLALGALALTGCWRSTACPTIQPRYEATLEAQRQALTQEAAEGGAVVAGIAVPRAVVQRLIDAQLKRTGRELKGARASVLGATVRLGGQWSEVSLLGAGACEGCLRVRLRGELEGSVGRGPLSIWKQAVPAETTLELPLRLETEVGGSSRLVAELRGVRDLQVKVKLPGVPEGFKPTLDELASRSASSALEALGGDLTILSWEPVQIEGTGLRLRAARLEISPDGQTLRLGWTLNVPGGGAALRLEDLKPEGDELRLALSPVALTWLSRAALLSGLLPSRLNEELKPDPGGDLHITLDSVTPTSSGDLHTAFTVWRLAEDGCFEASFQSSAAAQLQQPQVKLADGRGTTLDLKLRGVELLRSEGDDFGLKLALWWRSDFLAQTLDLHKSLIEAQQLELGGERLEIILRSIDVQPERVEVRLGLH